jgi:hypothetical protein
MIFAALLGWPHSGDGERLVLPDGLVLPEVIESCRRPASGAPVFGEAEWERLMLSEIDAWNASGGGK